MKVPSPRVMLPNMFTLAATLCGFSVMWLTMNADSPSDYLTAATLIPLACILDGFDGRIARMVHGETKFGMELDSLSDAVTFGVAPAFMLYGWALKPYGFAGLLIAFAFGAASMMRLARFNVQTADPAKGNRYFTGLPAPMGGLGIASVIAMQVVLMDRPAVTAFQRPFLAGYAVLLALLMVSEVPFRTFKDVRLTPRVRLLLVAIVACVVLVSVDTHVMVPLAALHALYLTTGLAGSAIRQTRRRAVAATQRGGVVIDEDDDA